MSDVRPADPTAPVQPHVDDSTDTPPAAPHELPQPASDLYFTMDGTSWIARVAGKGACGTGSYGLGLIEAVHFFRADEPDLPVREALLARGRFIHLFERELSELFAKATPIALPEDR